VSERRKEVVRRFGELCLGKGDLPLVAELVDEDVVDHRPMPGQLPGRRGIIDGIRAIRTAFPDLHVVAEDLVADGDLVCARWLLTGTHQGAFAGLAPTGRPFSIGGLELYRLAGNRIVELWPYFDTLSLFSQLEPIGDAHP